MPSWNIHAAHVERLMADGQLAKWGIKDANAFLFGSYVPDIYLGFMVHDITFRLDYCVTHFAKPSSIPVPDADHFRDDYIARRTPKTQAGLSLALGVWAHLAADSVYNSRFRAYCAYRGLTVGEELRKRKQADFDLFGHALAPSLHVDETPELLKAANDFRQYSILPADARSAITIANRIVDESNTSSPASAVANRTQIGSPASAVADRTQTGSPSGTIADRTQTGSPADDCSGTGAAAGDAAAAGELAADGAYLVLTPEWLNATFEACDAHLRNALACMLENTTPGPEVRPASTATAR